jgi:light-regulated signal transduction histidine kinase (bacteriophytochrome)
MGALNILLVDDRPENLVALEQILRQPDRALFKASSGNEALRLLLKHEFALILLDVEMPEMDGYETAQLIRSQERTRSVPIIFVTAGDRVEERLFRGYEVGAVDFLYKPVNAQILRSKVEVFAALHRKNAALAALNAELERTGAALQEKVADLEFVNRTLSHDLRAPVRSIQSFSELLAESLAGRLDEESASHLGRVVRASGRMGRMLDDLFELLRVSASAVALEEVDSAALLADVVENLRSDVERAGATVTGRDLPTLRANTLLFGQVLQNLIVNALKFRSDRPPIVEVSAERESNPGAWTFHLRDNGTGIAPAYQQQIFLLFQRLVGDSLPGTGVGLALCKRAVEKHGGRIWVESTPGEGSTFSFTIPI